jgi:hypothetical protein
MKDTGSRCYYTATEVERFGRRDYSPKKVAIMIKPVSTDTPYVAMSVVGGSAGGLLATSALRCCRVAPGCEEGPEDVPALLWMVSEG